jgi:hypothetical protein
MKIRTGKEIVNKVIENEKLAVELGRALFQINIQKRAKHASSDTDKRVILDDSVFGCMKIEGRK